LGVRRTATALSAKWATSSLEAASLGTVEAARARRNQRAVILRSSKPAERTPAGRPGSWDASERCGGVEWVPQSLAHGVGLWRGARTLTLATNPFPISARRSAASDLEHPARATLSTRPEKDAGLARKSHSLRHASWAYGGELDVRVPLLLRGCAGITDREPPMR